MWTIQKTRRSGVDGGAYIINYIGDTDDTAETLPTPSAPAVGQPVPSPGSVAERADGSAKYRLSSDGSWSEVVSAIDYGAAAIQMAQTNMAVKEKTGYGVLTGLAVAQQTVPDMTVKVSAGICYAANGARYVSIGVTALTITPDVSTACKGIVYFDADNSIKYLGAVGTAEAAPTEYPAVPANGVLLAYIDADAAATTIGTANITNAAAGLIGANLTTAVAALQTTMGTVTGDAVGTQLAAHAEDITALETAVGTIDPAGDDVATQLAALTPTEAAIETGDTVALADNTFYAGTDIVALTMTMAGTPRCKVSIATAAAGDMAVTFPAGTRYAGGTAPTIGNSEYWAFTFDGLNCFYTRYAVPN